MWYSAVVALTFFNKRAKCKLASGDSKTSYIIDVVRYDDKSDTKITHTPFLRCLVELPPNLWLFIDDI